MNPAPDDRPHVDPSTTRICLRRTWDAARERTAWLHPADCHAVLLDWQPAHWPDDGGMPAEIALALGSVLTELGTVVGRADEPSRTWPLTTLIPAPRRSLLQRCRDALLRRWPAEALARTRDPAETAVLLDCGWSVQHQAVLVLSSGGNTDAAIEALRYRSDWRDFRLEPPFAALVLPSNDGDGAMVAAPSAAALTDMVQRLDHAFRAAGFPVSHTDPPCPTMTDSGRDQVVTNGAGRP